MKVSTVIQSDAVELRSAVPKYKRDSNTQYTYRSPLRSPAREIADRVRRVQNDSRRYGDSGDRPGYLVIALCAIVTTAVICIINIQTPPSSSGSISPEMAAASIRLSDAAAGRRGTVGTPSSTYKQKIAARRRAFVSATGIADPNLIQSFAVTDANRDNRLSWEELGAFQTAMKRSFSYRRTNVYLRPDLFVKNSGGDSADWALLTASLLRYWGFEVYIGIFDSENGVESVCVIRVDSLAESTHSYQLKTPGITDSQSTHFVPVDHSRADPQFNKTAALIAIEVPEALYGRTKGAYIS